MVQTDSTEFFEGLSFIGWVGIFLWVVFFVLVLVKSEWFRYYEDRKPKMDMWDEFLYEDWHYFTFMIVRFLLMLFILFIVTQVMFRI